MFIDSISFYNNKAKNIYNTCIILTKKYNSVIPNTIEWLMTLPWVWIKTAQNVRPTPYNKYIPHKQRKIQMAIIEGTAYWASLTRPNEKFEPMRELI